MIEPPQPGESVLKLWLKVAELTKAVNALSNMKVSSQLPNSSYVIISGTPVVSHVAEIQSGKLAMDDSGCTLILS